MTNCEIIRAFEAGEVADSAFHHAEHVRLAFAYLSEFPPLEALQRFTTALKRFAETRGQSTLYHATITHAYFFLIRERMARDPADWDEFASRNADLLRWKDGVLSRYYSEAALQSDFARSVFVFPDRIC